LKQEKIKKMAELVGISQAPNGLSRQFNVSIIKKKRGKSLLSLDVEFDDM
jgi:hypothetical protein